MEQLATEVDIINVVQVYHHKTAVGDPLVNVYADIGKNDLLTMRDILTHESKGVFRRGGWTRFSPLKGTLDGGVPEAIAKETVKQSRRRESQALDDDIEDRLAQLAFANRGFREKPGEWVKNAQRFKELFPEICAGPGRSPSIRCGQLFSRFLDKKKLLEYVDKNAQRSYLFELKGSSSGPSYYHFEEVSELTNS